MQSRCFVLAAMWMILTVGLQTSEAFGASWVRLNFNFTDVSFVTADTKDSNTLYAGSLSGVYKTTDGGTTWKALKVGNVPLVANALVVSLQQPTTLYASSGPAVGKSLDGGETWQVTGSLPGGIVSLTIDPRNDDIVYAGQGCTVSGCQPSYFKTVNGGVTWTSTTLTLNSYCHRSVTDVAVDPTNSSRIYVTTSGCSDQDGFFWSIIPGSDHLTFLAKVSHFSPIVIDPQSPNILYAGHSPDGISKSEDRGTLWPRVDSGLPPGFSLSSLVIDPQFPNTLYAASYLTPGVFKSMDGGTSWTAVNDGLGAAIIRDLAISSGSPKTVFAATANSVFKMVEGAVLGSPHVGDLNGDGKSDILWSNDERNLRTWLMNGMAVNSSSALPSAPGWSTSGIGDFNGDGRDDIVRRGTSGGVEVWLMDGARILSSTTIATLWTGWGISGVGDFNGDGKDDILWRSLSGHVAIWLMDGTRIVSFHSLGNIWTGWTISGVGNFNGDHRADILWRAISGDVAIWLMDGPRIASFHTVASIWTGWTISGVGDFDGDDRADILWRSVSGDVAMWLMDGPRIASYHTVANIWTGWSITGVGDFDGDRHADILWQEGGGSVAIWRMNGNNIAGYDWVVE
jgi:FG-GAP-like repeat